jgi:hypothetical protein
MEKEMLKDQSIYKTKYGLFKTLKEFCLWIKYNLIKLVFTIFIGIILSLLCDVFMSDNNLLLSYINSFINSAILVGIIVYTYIVYLNWNYKLEIKTYVKLFFISTLFFMYNILIIILMEQIRNQIVSMLLQYFGYFLIILCIIDILKNKTIFGIKYSFNIISSNILYFIKIVLFVLILQLITIILFGIMLSTYSIEIKLKVLLSINIFIKIITAFIIIIFVTEKEKEINIYNKNLYVA